MVVGVGRRLWCVGRGGIERRGRNGSREEGQGGISKRVRVIKGGIWDRVKQRAEGREVGSNEKEKKSSIWHLQ